MIRPILIVIIGTGVAAGPPQALRVFRRTAPTAADCGAGTAIPPKAVASVVAAAVRSIVLEGAPDQGGRKKWCARLKPLFVISPERAEIPGCPRVVFVGRPDEVLRRADIARGGTDYIKLDLAPDSHGQFVEIMVERGRIVKGSDAVQVEIMRKHRAGDDQPTLFREELSHYRVTAASDRVEICRYSNIVI